mgnify:CR=1 FL=1
MTSEWPVVRVEDIAEKIAMGPFGSNIKVETFVETGIPVISGAHLRGIRLKDGEFNFVADEHAEKMKNSNVFRGDVIFTHAGNIGQVSYIPYDSKYERYVISQRQFYLRCDLSKADPAFVSYYFHSSVGQHKLLANASQTGVPSIARPSSYLRTIEFPLPPLAEQRGIVRILGALDDKIELNRKQNETLETMARAMFKAWFVDFEPVRAKMEGRWKRGQSLPGMPAHLYDLFPSHLIETDLGETPYGWRYVASGDVYDVGIGKTPPRKESRWFSDGRGNVPWVSIRDMGSCDVFICETSESITSEAVEKFNIRRIPAEAVLLSFKLTVGRVAMSECEMTSNEAIAHFKSKDGSKSHRFLYCYLSNYDYSSLGSTSSIATATNSKTIRGMPVLVPSVEILDAFEKCVESIFEKIKNNSRQCRVLVKIRDIVLPKLISGGVRIQNVEQLLQNM